MDKIFYSKSTGGFYCQSIHGSNMPGDAKEITQAQHAALLDAQAAGKSIVADADGFPIEQDPVPPTLVELIAAKNAQINIWRAEANTSKFTHQGKNFACDALSRSDLDGTAATIALTGAFPPGFPNGWKAIDDTYIGLPTVESFGEFYAAMSGQGSANFARAQALKGKLAQVQDQAGLDAITWDMDLSEDPAGNEVE